VSSLSDVQERTDYVSYEAFLAASDETHAEWVDGRVIPMSPASQRHQKLADLLTALLLAFTEAHSLGTVLSAPFQMKLSPEGPGREPDVLFVASANLERLKKNRLEGPADLVVEIISPESRARDRGEKFYEYEQGGVTEYWLIDPDREQAEFYRLDARGIYQLVPLQGGAFQSKVLPGLRLEVAWLWEEPLPPLLSILKLWKLV
jgi:Uma2 family endonuclease